MLRRPTLKPFIPSLLAFAATLTFAPGRELNAMEPEWVSKWQADLAFAEQVLSDRHPSPFDTISAEEMQAAFDELVERLPDMDHHAVIVELAEIVASIEDGHTRLTLPLGPGVDFMQGHSETERPILAEMEFHQFPVRLGVDATGPWLRAASKDLEGLLGARLVAVDGVSIDQIVEKVEPTIQRDNPMQVLHHLPMHLVLPELLHALGVTQSPAGATFTFETRQGRVEQVPLSSMAADQKIDWVDVEGATGHSMPLVRQRTGENFWFTFVEPSNLVYLQFNMVYDKDDQTVRQFSEELLTLLTARPDAALVIDLRRNRGGNQSLALPLLHAVIASPQNRAGQLFTIVGRTTFSAAMTFSLLMEKHTQTLFIGESTGSKPNHYGDSRKQLLPNSNITLRVSSLYWQWNPRDTRQWIAPHVEAPPSREAALAGEDQAMQAVRSIIGTEFTPTPIEGDWSGNLPPASFGSDSLMKFDPLSKHAHATVDVPPFGLKGAAVQGLQVEAGRIDFQIVVGSETVVYRGRVSGPWIVGHGELGSVRFPFLLKQVG